MARRWRETSTIRLVEDDGRSVRASLWPPEEGKSLEWLNALKKAEKGPSCDVNLLLTDKGFSIADVEYCWSDVRTIEFSIIDQFTYDILEVHLDIDGKQVLVSELFEEFVTFAERLVNEFPETEEPLEFLSTHAFSGERFRMEFPQLES